MVAIEHNTYFSSILSRKKEWSIKDLVELANKMLAPFDLLGTDMKKSSLEVEMLQDISNLLLYKIDCFKSIIRQLEKDGGLSCDEIEINIFNAGCGIDSIACLKAMCGTNRIKAIRLFDANKKKLERALLMHKILFPQIATDAYDSSDYNIDIPCNALMSINICPHTCCNNQKETIAILRSLKKSHQIYSHTVFLECVYFGSPFLDGLTDYYIPMITERECDYYWRDLNMRRLYKNDSINDSCIPSTQIHGNKCKLKYSVFTCRSIEDMKIGHEYNIDLPNLCPGVIYNKLFNMNQLWLFFEQPFKDKEVCLEMDTDTPVFEEEDFITGEKTPFTLKYAIKNFPQYYISTALNNKEPWAQTLYDYYLKEADSGNFQCYNNLAVLKLLCLNDFMADENSEQIITIVSLLNKAAEAGDINAMINLASFYMARKSFGKALQYYELADKHNEACATFSLGVAYHLGVFGVDKDYDKAIKYYKNALDRYNSDDESASIVKNRDPYKKSCCVNLIILMYQQGASLYDITIEYNKVKKPSPELVYAYDVISSLLTNTVNQFFITMRQKQKDVNEASYMKFNRIVALYSGVKYLYYDLKPNREEALKQLHDLSESGCKDWPEWETYVWPLLAIWTNGEGSAPLRKSYWLKAAAANPDKGCAYHTNISLLGLVSEEEKKQYYKKYAYGSGCIHCHEVAYYNEKCRCCPKAQFEYAKKYENNKEVAKCLIKEAANQGYKKALEEIAIYDVKNEYASEAEANSLEEHLLVIGSIPDVYKKIMDKFIPEERYAALCKAAEQGSRKAVTILASVSKLRSNRNESIYWNMISHQIDANISILQDITGKSISGCYFYPHSLLEEDLLKCANKKAEQFIGDDAFDFLLKYADFYVRGGNSKKAIELYKVALKKGHDVSQQIQDLESKIAEERRYYNDSRYDEYYSHYDEYAGSYAQDVMGYSDEEIDDAFDGDPDAYWNID